MLLEPVPQLVPLTNWSDVKRESEFLVLEYKACEVAQF